jgi:hypothetical protein
MRWIFHFVLKTLSRMTSLISQMSAMVTASGSSAVMNMERAKGFEPLAGKSEHAHNQGVTSNGQTDYTQIRAQKPDAASPDLAKVVAAWDKLTAPLKQAVLSIVESISNGGPRR